MDFSDKYVINKNNETKNKNNIQNIILSYWLYMYLNWMQYFDKQKQFKFVNLALSTGRNILITKTI